MSVNRRTTIMSPKYYNGCLYGIELFTKLLLLRIARKTVSNLVVYWTHSFHFRLMLVTTLRSSSSNLLGVPNRVKTVTASFAFRVAACISVACSVACILNNLPYFVKVADSFNIFKRRLKCNLFDEAFLTTAFFQPASLSCSLTSSDLRCLK